jgi:hypothetical protein
VDGAEQIRLICTWETASDAQRFPQKLQVGPATGARAESLQRSERLSAHEAVRGENEREQRLDQRAVRPPGPA